MKLESDGWGPNKENKTKEQAWILSTENNFGEDWTPTREKLMNMAYLSMRDWSFILKNSLSLK